MDDALLISTVIAAISRKWSHFRCFWLALLAIILSNSLPMYLSTYVYPQIFAAASDFSGRATG